MTPLISIIVPTYNNVSLLPQTLDGISQQGFTDFETIVVDDGSTDGTESCVKKGYATTRYIFQSNRGPAAARNAGVAIARGEFIAFCDHDDLWNSDHLQSLLDGFNANPAAALVFDNAEYFGAGVTARKPHLDEKACRELSRKAVRPKTLLWKYPIASMSVMMVRKVHLDRLGGLSERVGALDDLHFYLRVAAQHEVRFVNYLGCKKRVTHTNLSQLINIKETNVFYLEDLWRHHPDVVRAVGPLNYRLRLAKKYFKLARYYKRSGELALAKELYWKAYKTNFMNPRYIWHGLFN